MTTVDTRSTNNLGCGFGTGSCTTYLEIRTLSLVVDEAQTDSPSTGSSAIVKTGTNNLKKKNQNGIFADGYALTLGVIYQAFEKYGGKLVTYG